MIAAHAAAGECFEAAGIRSFVRAGGEGDPVVLMHGLPASSFLYRKVIDELADSGLRGIAFDLPGLGLAARPTDFDYTLAGLGRFAAAAVDALGLERFHLVVHDAGGPVGFELARAVGERVRTLTILNTVIELGGMPFPMEVYARLATGDRWPALPPRRITRELMYRVGIANRSAVPPVEVDAYREFVLREDNGRAYLQIMRRLKDGDGGSYRDVVDIRRVGYPIQVVWAARDPVLPLKRQGWAAREATGVPSILTLPGKHYFQEDFAPELGRAITDHAGRG